MAREFLLYTVDSERYWSHMESPCHKDERPGRTVDIEAKWSQGDRWLVHLHAKYGHLVLELVDIGAGRVRV